ncbi:MAG: HipA domain-containing protein [Atopobiaceae bacterium]|nr:HipA domain-containing protein [Atopobiaceae bacterium]
MRHLYAWDNDILLGRFDDQNGIILFSYEPSASYPISLSLPIDGNWAEGSPATFLNGLLPESNAQRLQMMHSIGAPSTDAFDLLDSVDSTGGLVFTTTETPPSLTASASIATDADIEAQMQRVYDTSDAWWHEDEKNRFSLAGNQGKFSLAHVNGMWFWPNATLPSTHIVKPDGRRVPDVALIENATMEVARRVGMSTSTTQVLQRGERTGLLVTRFDREYDPRQHVIRRLRTEDMTQAMGASSSDKYDFEVHELVTCLRKGGASDEVLYDLMRQIAFNTCIGNHDAHAKNYSVFIMPTGVRLTPLYDVICMAHWSEFKYDSLAIPVNDKYDAWEITIEDWRTEATRCGLDPDRIEEMVRSIASALLSLDYDTLPCGTPAAHEISDYVRECCRDLLPSLGL